MKNYLNNVDTIVFNLVLKNCTQQLKVYSIVWLWNFIKMT